MEERGVTLFSPTYSPPLFFFHFPQAFSFVVEEKRNKSRNRSSFSHPCNFPRINWLFFSSTWRNISQEYIREIGNFEFWRRGKLHGGKLGDMGAFAKNLSMRWWCCRIGGGGGGYRVYTTFPFPEKKSKKSQTLLECLQHTTDPQKKKEKEAPPPQKKNWTGKGGGGNVSPDRSQHAFS